MQKNYIENEPVGTIDPEMLDAHTSEEGAGAAGDVSNLKEARPVSRTHVSYPKVAISPRGVQPAGNKSGTTTTNNSDTNPTTGSRTKMGQTTTINTGGNSTSMNSSTAELTEVFVMGTLPTRGPAEQYSFALLSDGRVRYVGERNTKMAGTFYARPDASKVTELQQAFTSFMETRPSSVYPPEERYAADMPGTQLTYPAADGSEGQITVYYNAPSEYETLMEQIKHFIAEERWEK